MIKLATDKKSTTTEKARVNRISTETTHIRIIKARSRFAPLIKTGTVPSTLKRRWKFSSIIHPRRNQQLPAPFQSLFLCTPHTQTPSPAQLPLRLSRAKNGNRTPLQPTVTRPPPFFAPPRPVWTELKRFPTLRCCCWTPPPAAPDLRQRRRRVHSSSRRCLALLAPPAWLQPSYRRPSLVAPVVGV